MTIHSVTIGQNLNSQPVPGWTSKVQQISEQQNKPNSPKSKTKETNKSQTEKSKQSDNTEKVNSKENQIIQKLKQRDAEVRQHETAHKTAGGPHAGSVHYTYQQGPDGNKYAVGGSVNIDTQPVPGKPKETIEKARKVKEAALAPANPSTQDLKIASKAARMMMEAKAKLNKTEINPNTEENKDKLQAYKSKDSKSTNSFSLIA